nr:hypothetical protein ycf35 [Eunotogramma sp.]
MSHLTNLETVFQHRSYLEQALTKLDINWKREKNIQDQNGKEFSTINLVIPQDNGSDIKFGWNDQENKYELMIDTSFWKQSTTPQDFLGKVGQKYAGQLIVGEANKMGFKPSSYQEETNGTTKLVLQRWSN